MDPDLGQHPGGTPVVIGVGQFSERSDDPDYAALAPADLAAAAAREALTDTGCPSPEALAAAIDVLACTRQFDDSFPGMPAPLGRSDNLPHSVARRLAIAPARTVYEVSGGQSPQHLVTEMARDIASGRARVALVAGAEAISTLLDLVAAPERPDWSDQVGSQPGDDDRGAGLEGLVTRYQADHRLTDAPTQYALLENARRARLKMSRADYALSVGRLLASFTEVAAANPHAASPVARTAAELVDVTDGNRQIVDPYPKNVVSREKVNQAAAVLITSEAVAEELGIPRTQWVYLRGHSDLHDRELIRRPDLSTSIPSVRAVEAALELAGIGLDDVSTLDLYSCFPVAVSTVCDGLGLEPDDPRGLTVTGGLPFFGGPGNGYSLHAIAETVHLARATPGSWGLVGANGGAMSKYSAGVYSTSAGPWVESRDHRLQAELDAEPGPDIAVHADGWGTIETATVQFKRNRRHAVVVGRLEDGRRFLANDVEGDDQVVDLLLGEDVVGSRVFVRSLAQGNRVAVDEQRMDELLPLPEVGFRDSYEFVELRRDGHLLEITINRPEARNALTPQANQELADVVDAYLADRDLWAAIITGAGDKAFCAGNDLKYTASGQPMWVPKTGFAGLTSRRGLTKPVIAVLNGHALGGGFEIALACHLVVAEEHAEMGLTEVKIGLIAGAGGLVRLPRAVPPHVAHEMILTGRRITAQEALRWGIVNRLAAPGSGLETARALAAELLDGSPTSVRLSLELMEQGRSHPDPVDAVTAPSDVLDRLLVARDTTEGITAFAEKRAPQWRNQ